MGREPMTPFKIEIRHSVPQPFSIHASPIDLEVCEAHAFVSRVVSTVLNADA